MQFEKLVQNIIRENTEISKNELKIINENIIPPFIKQNMEGALEQFKENYRGDIPPKYDNIILNVYKEFLDAFKYNVGINLKTTFDWGHILDTRIKIVGTREKDTETPERKKGYMEMFKTKRAKIYSAGFVLCRSIESEAIFVVPFTQTWDSMNYINQTLSETKDWEKRFENEDININWFYGLGDFNFRTVSLPEVEVKRKKFNMDMIPEKAYDLLDENSAGKGKSGTISGNLLYKAKEEVNRILRDLTEEKFEDTIKSQKIGKVLSRL